MAQIGHFDATQVAPATKPPAMPTGWYNVMITDSEMKANKAQTGHYLQLGLKVIDGPYAGRMAFDRLNLLNPNPTAVKIAQETLSAICHATGVMQVQDSQQLHGIPLQARLLKKEADGDYDESNDVKGYAKIGSHPIVNQLAAPTPATPGAPRPPAPAGPPAAPSAPPAPTPPPAPSPAPTAPAPAPQPAAPAYTPPPAAPAPAPATTEAPPQPAAAGADATTPPWLR